MSAFLVICILLLVLYFLVPTSIGLKDTKSPEQTKKIFQTVFKEQMNQSKAPKVVNTDPNDAIKDTDSDTPTEMEGEKPMVDYATRSKNHEQRISQGGGLYWECDKSEDCYTKYKVKNEDRHMYNYNCIKNKCEQKMGGIYRRRWECDNSEDCYTTWKIKDEDRHMYKYLCINNVCMGKTRHR